MTARERDIDLYDVVLKFSMDGGQTWSLATKENFPEKGVQIVLPYPEGTDGKNFDFVISHMFTTGALSGQTEQVKYVKTAKGLQITLHALSPLAVGWKKIKTSEDTSAGSSVDSGSGTAGTAEVSPKTADESLPVFWGTLAIVSVAGIMVFFGKRKEREDMEGTGRKIR